MQIEGRFLDNGKNCYVIRDNTDFRYNVTYRGLYMSDVLEGLKASGYKILDYEGHILTPEGISIEEIALSDNTLSQVDIDAMYTMDDLAVTEAEATAYYERDIRQNFVELRQPNIRIKTREELIEYLMNYASLERLHMADMDCLPLNSFVAPEALFTFEEIQQNYQVRYYMDIVESRRVLKSFAAYQKLVNFLQSEGLLKQSYTADEIKTAYLSWGICGIRSMFTRIEDKYGVRSNIFSHDAAADASGNRVCYNLMDKEGRIISLSGVYDDFATCENFSEREVYPAVQETYFKLYRSRKQWDSQYQFIQCMEPQSRTRTLGHLLDDTGVAYKMFLDMDTILITTSRGNVLMQRYLILCTYNGTRVAIDTFKNEQEYRDWCLYSAKAHDIVEKHTMHSDVDSSYELLHKEGLFDGEIIQYMARRVEEDRALNNGYDATVHFNQAESLYRGEIEEIYVRKYNPDNLPYDTIPELIDIMLDTKAALESQNKYLAIDKSSIVTEQQCKDELMLRPLEQLEFAKDAVNGFINIDYLAAGIREDSEVDYVLLINFLRLCYKVFGKDQLVEDFLMHVTDTNDFVDWRMVVRERDQAYWGAIRDTAELNAIRARESVIALYVTNIYRELSLEDPERQRHYAFQGLVLRLDDKKHNPSVQLQKALAEIVQDTLDKMQLPFMLRDALKTEALNIALELIFRVAFDNNLKITKSTGDIYILTMQHLLRNEHVILEIPVSLRMLEDMQDKSRYVLQSCKLSDWCRFSFLQGRSRMYCLNAAIDPWHITPKSGVKLNSYNFAINYLSEAAYEQAISKELRDKCSESHAKVDVLMQQATAMLVTDKIDNSFINYKEVDMEVYLQNIMFLESMDQYFTRFSIKNAEAKKENKLIYKLRSKSDTTFGAYADRDSDDYMNPDEDEYVEMTDELKGKWYKTIDVLPVGEATFGTTIEAGRNVISRFDINSEAFEDVIRWKSLLDGTFVQNAVLMLFGTKLFRATSQGNEILDLKSISIAECESMTDEGTMYRLSAREFLIRTSNGNYKLEVR